MKTSITINHTLPVGAGYEYIKPCVTTEFEIPDELVKAKFGTDIGKASKADVEIKTIYKQVETLTETFYNEVMKKNLEILNTTKKQLETNNSKEITDSDVANL